MNSNPTDDELLRSYLLGELSEEKADAVEGRLLTEDDLFELSEAIEADLLAEYAQGLLAPAEREHVQRRLASSPQGRERLKLARSLSILAERDRKAAVLTFARRAAALQRPALRWAALAAGLLVAVGLAWLILQWSNTGGGTQKPPKITDTVTTHPVQNPPQPHAPKPPVAPAPEPVKAVVFQLALASLRGSEAAETKLRIPAGTGTVELQISVAGMEDLESFHLTVRNQKGETVRDWRELKPKSLKGAWALVADLPAEALPAGKYQIQVQGLAHGSEPEDLSPLEVEVVREGKD